MEYKHTSVSRYNNFNILRFVAAFFVIVGHMYYIMGSVPFVVYGQAVSTIGVKILFLLSGYFITLSYLSDNGRHHIIKYAIKRTFRIFPALIFVVIACMLAGALVSTLPLGEYFGSTQFWKYLDNIRMYPRYALPGVFTDNPYPSAVNGSLWTMPVELFMYVCVPLFCLFHRCLCRIPGGGIGILFGLITLLSLVLPFMGIKRAVLYGTDWCAALAILPYYLAGCAYAHFRRYRHLWNLQLAAFLMFLLGCTSLGQPANEILFLLIFSYFIFSFGCSEKPFFASCFKKYDLSYGMYLWGFPVQQMLVHCFPGTMSYAGYLVLTVAIVMTMSFISFVFVEKPMISCAKRLTTKF